MRKVLVVLVLLLSPALTAQTMVSYNRGDTVRLLSRDQMKPTPDPRIIAVGGDRVRIDKSGVFVNEIPLTWVSRDFAANYGERPWDSMVPQGHYAVIADYRQNHDVSQFLGFISANTIIGRVDDINETRDLLLPR